MSKTLGIVGGGQLGAMLAESAHKLGLKVIVLDPTEKCPASFVADAHILGDVKDPARIRALAERADFLTFEIELAESDVLAELAQAGIPVNPTGKTLRQIKNKYEQKVFLQKQGIPVAPFLPIATVHDADAFGQTYGYPFILKANLDSYDGRGNHTVTDSSKLTESLSLFSGKSLYAEAMIPFAKELAVIVVRDMMGTIVLYPTTQTLHTRHICDTTITPAPVPTNIAHQAQELARQTISLFKGAGAFGVEMFLLPNDTLLVNEIAPRVHNSGHYSIEYCDVSQFENHVRAVTGLPLKTPTSASGVAVMKNILGERNAPAEPEGIEQARALGSVSVHLYNKHETKIDRKMGHLTVVAKTIEEAVQKAERARALVHI